MSSRGHEIFERVRRLPASEREQAIADACGSDLSLKAEVEGLLAADARGATTAAGDGQTTFRAPSEEVPGAQVGPYTLLQALGEGGFGTVYVARQERPVQRQVALKILKLGMDTREVVARFEQERQVLALMDHPHIARVLDAGATAAGRLYFVMELVKGEPIAHFCDRNNLTIPHRLELFAQVCSAVQHAHTKGIIHRDLKPSNALVSMQDGKPFARVIDFGIAKAISGRLTEKTIFTEHGRLMGTPEYMSPEQADGSLDIDTRSDIYSLGALLYELLTGTPPFDRQQLRSAGYGEIQRIIREVDPPTPSARLSQSTDTLANVAARRRTEPTRLGRTLRGELDWIVMKAMDKDRQRRYETANGLALDVGRYLAGDPVGAAPPGAAYRVRKFARRHRGGVVAGALITAALVVGLGGALWQARVAARERDAARKAEAEARAVAEFQSTQLADIDVAVMARRLRERLLSEAKTGLERSGMSGAAATAASMQQFEEVLARANLTNVALANLDENIFSTALKAADEQFRDQPIVRAKLLDTIGSTMGSLGLYERATAPLKEALALRRRWLGDADPSTLDSLQQFGLLRVEAGHPREGEAALREAVAARQALGVEKPETFVAINQLGFALSAEGRHADSEKEFRSAYEGLRRVAGDDDKRTLAAHSNLALALMETGKLADAEKHYRDVVDRNRRTGRAEDSEAMNALNNLAVVLVRLGKLTEAETHAREAVEVRRRISGDDHPNTLAPMVILADILLKRGQADDAERLIRDAVERANRTLGPDHPRTWETTGQLAKVLEGQGRFTDAEPYHRQVLDARRRLLGADHPDTLVALHDVGALLIGMGRFAEAEPVNRDALERRRRINGPDHPGTISTANNLAFALFRQGKFAEAEPFFREIAAAQERLSGREDPWAAIYRMGLARTMMGLGRREEAEKLLLDVERVLAASESPRGSHLRSMQVLVELYESWDKTEPGRGHGDQAARWKEKIR